MEHEKGKQNETSSFNDTSWGSINDSDLLLALKQQSLNAATTKPTTAAETEIVNQLNDNELTDQDTDIDTDDDSKHLTGKNDATTTTTNKAKYPTVSGSDDWGSMNDSQFISFINKLSQSRNNLSNISNSQNRTKENVNETLQINDESDVSKGISTPKSSTKENFKSQIENISSSPLLFAQKQNSNDGNDNELLSDFHQDIITEQDIEDSNKYAFEDHEGYFKTKKSKQEKQDQEYSKFIKEVDESGKSYPPIFENCAIHVNGRTEPDILQLRKMIVLYGGKYVHYLSSKGVVTHIVAESLPPRKRIQFGNCKVVRPKWIVDSIEQGKLLNWADYRLEQLAEYGQKPIMFPIVKPSNETSGTYVSPGGEQNEEDNDAIVDQNAYIENLEQNEQNEQKSQEEEDILSQELTEAGVDAKHPDFLKIFFSKSRLHHLSTWKSDLRSEFLTKAMHILKERKPATVSNMNNDSANRIILHVDFDCFFATVSAKVQNPPIDITKIPCCVTHGGVTADVSSCNYVARSKGVSNGMWMSKAKQLCPNIVSLPYQFDEYEKISNIFYEKLLSLNIDSILPVSIDEALVDISSLCESNNGDVYKTVSEIKSSLDRETGCTVSCGCGHNVLLAKLALKQAKPNGIYIVPKNEDETITFLNNIDVNNLPRFGYRLYDKLRQLVNAETNAKITLKHLRNVDKEKLTSTFGIKMGEKLYDYSRGLDTTSIDILSESEKYLRKSLGIDVNWGIRFNSNTEVEIFLHRLAGELSKRLIDCHMFGSSLTLKLSVRHPNAPIEPAKYLGMGYCTFVSKSSRLGISTRTQGVLSSEMKYLWRVLNVEPKELRGVGVSMTKLVPEDVGKIDDTNQMRLDFTRRKAVKKAKETTNDVFTANPILQPEQPKIKMENISPKRRTVNDGYLDAEIDWEVFDNLPQDLQNEIKKELRRRKLQASPKKRKVITNDKDIAVLLSPSKKTPKHESPSVKTYMITPERIHKQEEKHIMFQGINVSAESEIIQKLFVWMDFTLDADNGIDEKDLELFKDFMIKLISGNEILRYQRILNAMVFHARLKKNSKFYNIWINELQSLKYLLDEQSFSLFEFNF